MCVCVCTHRDNWAAPWQHSHDADWLWSDGHPTGPHPQVPGTRPPGGQLHLHRPHTHCPPHGRQPQQETTHRALLQGQRGRQSLCALRPNSYVGCKTCKVHQMYLWPLCKDPHQESLKNWGLKVQTEKWGFLLVHRFVTMEFLFYLRVIYWLVLRKVCTFLIFSTYIPAHFLAIFYTVERMIIWIPDIGWKSALSKFLHLFPLSVSQALHITRHPVSIHSSICPSVRLLADVGETEMIGPRGSISDTWTPQWNTCTLRPTPILVTATC